MPGPSKRPAAAGNRAPVLAKFRITHQDIAAVDKALAYHSRRVANDKPGCTAGFLVFVLVLYVFITAFEAGNGPLILVALIGAVGGGYKMYTWVQSWRRNADPFKQFGISPDLAHRVAQYTTAYNTWAAAEKKRQEVAAAARRAEEQRRAAEEERKQRLERERKREEDRRERRFWQSLTGRQFEEELAAVYTSRGFSVRTTPASGDQGVDLILEKPRQTIVVQCKRHGKPAGQRYVRELYGAMIHFGAKKAVLACTSGFTESAKAFAEGKPIQLLDLDGIMRLARKRPAA